MKTKIKRMSKRTLAMLLGVLMLVTSIGLGTLITVNAFTGSNTVYFKDTANWGTVYVHFYSKAYGWQYGGYDHGGTQSGQGWVATGQMSSYTTVDSKTVYSYTYNGNWTHIAFTKDNQESYDHFYQTSLVPCNDGYSASKPMCDPGSNVAGQQTNSCSVYRNYSWNAAPAAPVSTYSVNIGSMTHGSVEASSSTAAEGSSVTLTAIPDYGYKLSTISIAGVTLSGSGNTRTFTMPSNDVTVSATFVEDTDIELYLGGRLAVKNSSGTWYYPASSAGTGTKGSWVTNPQNIQLTRTGAFTYTLNTYISPSEMNSTNSGGDPYFFFYDKTNNKLWQPSSEKEFTGISGSETLSKYDSHHASMKINNSSTIKPVTFTLNISTGAFSYSIPTTHNVKFTNKPTGGTVTVNDDSSGTVAVVENTDYTIKAKPADGYTVDTVKVGTTTLTAQSGGSDASGYTYVSNVGTADKTVNATFMKKDYTITDSAGSHGSVSHSGTAQYDETITVTATPDPHYSLDTLSVYKTGDPNTKVTVTNNQFTMPAYNVTISATFAETKYNVTVNNNGTSSIKSTGYFTSQSTGAHAAKTGYTQNGWEVTSGSVYVNGTKYTNGQTISGDSITFTTEEVAALTALYTANTHKVTYSNAADQYTISNVSSGASGSSVAYGTTVSYTVSGVTNDTVKYVVTDVTVDGATSPTYDTSTGAGSFTMPDSDVQIVPTGKFQYKVTFSQPSNGTLTVKNGSTNVTSGSYVDANANLTVTLKTNEGYELNTATGVTFGQPTATTSSLTYTGSVTVDAAKVFSVSTKAISQHTVTLTGNNVTFQVKYTKNKTAVTTYTDYSAPLVVDNGSTLSVKAVTSGFYSISEWKDGTTTLANTDAEQTFTVSSDKNITATATKSSSSDCIYVKLSNVGTKIYYYLYGSQTNGDFPGKLMVNGSTLGSDVAYDSTTGIYCISGDGSGSPLKDGAGIVFSDGTDHYKSGDLTVNLGSTYTIKSGGDGYGHQWGADVQKVGDPTENTVLKISKKSGADTDITGVYIYGGSDLLGSFDDCKNNIKNNTTSIASKATLDKTSDANYYIVTIPNINFTSSDGLFNAIVIINGHANDGDQTSDIEGKQIGYTYVIDIKNYNGSSKKFDVEVSSEDEGDAKYYLAGEYSDGTSQFFGTAWSPNTNELTKNGSVYEKTFTSNIPAGTIKFKVVKNGDWDEGSWPDENQTYVIQPNATSVKFSFNPTTGKITVTQTNSEGGGDTVTGWMYSGTAAANRTEVNPTSGMTTFDASKEQSNEYGKFRFMYGTSDNSLTNVIVPSNYKTGDDSNAYWAELTSSMSKDNNAHFFFGLTNYWNQGNMVGNKGEKINDSTGTKVITDKDGSNLFTIATQEHNDVTSSAKFVNIYGVNWEKVAAIGVKAYDNSKSTNGNNTHNNKVDYQIYYKAKVAAPVKEAQVVDIVAKNGTLRDSTFNRFTNLANTDFVDYFSYEETDAEGVTTTYNSITDYNSAHSNKQIVIENDINYGGSTYAKMTNVPVGAKIKLKTTLSSDANKEGSFDGKAFKDTHYLKGYSFNGMTYEIHEPNTTGVYEETWTVRAVNTTYTDKNDALQQATTNGNTVEVTPVYYMKDTTNVKTFYIDGYDGEVQEAWGNMLTVYPYYEGISNSGNAFGGYPGQPMLFWGGKYQMEIPLTVDGTATGASVKGLTLHNGYWDLLHRSIDIRCNTRNHAQTYDYDDFYKLYKEKDPDTIIFDFKYRTKTDNYSDGYNYTNYTFAGNTAKSAADFVNENGVELVTDYFGRQVDAFGNLIKDAEKSDWDTTQEQDKELLFVSTGYKDTYVGEYATLWAVYAPETDMKGGDTSNKFIGYISSSMLYLKDFDRVKQYAGGTLETNGRMSWSEFKSTYNHLKTYYTGVPALISYEKEIWNDSKDKANRSDGKWYYSNKSDKIQASIKIQYGPYSLIEAPDHSVSSDAWKDDPFDATQTGVGGQKNIGTSTNCSAYFTNTSPNLLGKVESGEQFADSTKTFTFQAVPSGSYMFAGWVRYSNGKYYEITENELGSSSMSANDVYIARFVTAKTGTLTVQHVVEQTDTFTGTGTPELTVTIKNGDTVVNTTGNHVSDGSKIDVSKWIDIRNKDYTIDITLKTTPTNESFMKEIVSSSGNFAASTNKWNTDKTATDSSGAITTAQTTTVAQFTVGEILDSGVTSLRYVSHLMKPKYTYNYSIVYTYTSRFWGEQSYTVTGTFEDDSDFAANATGSKTSAKLNTDFIINKTPYEKNFRQTINWNYTSSAVGNAKAMENVAATDDGNNTYTMTAHVYSANDDSKKVKAEIFLPYNLNDFSEDTGYTAKGMDVYSAATDGSKTGETAVVYDETVEPVSLETEAYKLFTYAGEKVSGGNDVIPSSLKLVEAAPYVLCKSYDSATGKYTPVDFHTHLASTKRYMTGNSFKVGNVTYYLNELPEGVPENDTNKVINASNVANYTVTFTKPGNDYQTTYKYAVEGEEDGHRVIYFFAYNMNALEEMVDNEGNKTTTPVFNGQYIIYREYDEVDGVVQGNYQRKYFTRWDITNSKGEFVASCYSRKFNYTGYENYVVRAIYESDVEQEFYNEGSEGTSASITYLGDTRNQWNNGALGDYANVTKKSDGNTAGDKLLHDFAITYYYNGKEIQAIESTEKEIKVGMMIEQLGKLETIGGEKVYDSSYYANEYKGNNTSATLKNCLEHGGNPKDTTNLTTINSKIGANVANFGTQFGTAANTATAKMNFNSVIDNFNRLQWFYTFNNTKTNGVIGETNNANYAYRAWSYIIVDGVATISNTPAYFTLYDSAHR